MAVESSGYKIKGKEIVIQEDAAFRGRIMIEIENPKVEHRNILKLKPGAKVYTTIFTEPWNKLARGVHKAVKKLDKQKMTVTKVFFMYLTCPVCSQEKGYKTIIVCKVKEHPKQLEKQKNKEAKKAEKIKARELEKKKKEKEKANKKAEKEMRKQEKIKKEERQKKQKELEKKKKEQEKINKKAEKEKKKLLKKQKKERKKKAKKAKHKKPKKRKK